MGTPFTSADQLIGKTPLLELTRLEQKHGLAARILAKVEAFQPAGSVKDRVAKAMLDAGIHPPTMYFPLIVHEALMFEPTETESPETLDEAAAVLAEILRRAKEEPEALHAAPASTPVGRPDETAAARRPVVRYAFPEG